MYPVQSASPAVLSKHANDESRPRRPNHGKRNWAVELATLKDDLNKLEIDQKVVQDTACSSKQKKAPSNKHPNVLALPRGDSLRHHIKMLEEENNRYKELSDIAFQQVVEAQALQAAAEAEVEGLQYLECASEKLMEQHHADTKQILDLVRRLQCMVKIQEHKEAESDGIQLDSDYVTPSVLNFSTAITGACTTLVDVQNEKTEFEDLKRYLYSVETEKEKILSNFTTLSNKHCEMAAAFDTEVEDINALHELNLRLIAENENLESQLEVQAQLLRVKDQNIKQQVAQARAELKREFQAKIDALENQRHRPVSTFSDPKFVASLREHGNPTRSRSKTPRCRNPRCAELARNAARKPALNITLRPSDTGLWSLLRHIPRTVYCTSALNIDGPQDLTQEFLACIEEAEKEFTDQAQQLARLESTLTTVADEIRGVKKHLESDLVHLGLERCALEEGVGDEEDVD